MSEPRFTLFEDLEQEKANILAAMSSPEEVLKIDPNLFHGPTDARNAIKRYRELANKRPL